MSVPNPNMPLPNETPMSEKWVYTRANVSLVHHGGDAWMIEIDEDALDEPLKLATNQQEMLLLYMALGDFFKDNLDEKFIASTARHMAIEEAMEVVEKLMPLRGISTKFQSWITDGPEDTMKARAVILTILEALKNMK